MRLFRKWMARLGREKKLETRVSTRGPSDSTRTFNPYRAVRIVPGRPQCCPMVEVIKNERYHEIMSILIAGLFVAYVVILFQHLQ